MDCDIFYFALPTSEREQIPFLIFSVIMKVMTEMSKYLEILDEETLSDCDQLFCEIGI